MPGRIPLLKDKTFLIVEDDMFLRTMMVEDIESSELKCLSAESSQDAIEIIKQNEVDIIISDVRMPKGGGLELFRSLKEEGLSQGKTCYLVSGCNDVSPNLLRELNIVDVFEKPFIISDVLAQIAERFK